MQQLSHSLSHLDVHFPGEPGLAGTWNVSILDFMGTKDDGGDGDNWSYKTCKAPVKSSPPTPSIFTGRMPFLSPNEQCQSKRCISV